MKKHRIIILAGAAVAIAIIAALTWWNYHPAGADMTTPRTPLPIPTQFGVAAGRAGATALYLPGRGDSAYQIQYRLADQTPPETWTLTSGVAGIHHLALAEGMTYDIRVRTVSSAGIAGAWSDTKTIVAGPQTEPVPDAMVTQELATVAREQATEQFIGAMAPPRTPGHIRYGVILSSTSSSGVATYRIQLYAGAGLPSQVILATEPGELTWLVFRPGQDVWVQHIGAALWEIVIPADHIREAFYGQWQVIQYNGLVNGSPDYGWGGEIPFSAVTAPRISIIGATDRTGWRQNDRILASFFGAQSYIPATGSPTIQMVFDFHANVSLMLRQIADHETRIGELEDASGRPRHPHRGAGGRQPHPSARRRALTAKRRRSQNRHIRQRQSGQGYAIGLQPMAYFSCHPRIRPRPINHGAGPKPRSKGQRQVARPPAAPHPIHLEHYLRLRRRQVPGRLFHLQAKQGCAGIGGYGPNRRLGISAGHDAGLRRVGARLAGRPAAGIADDGRVTAGDERDADEIPECRLGKRNLIFQSDLLTVGRAVVVNVPQIILNQIDQPIGHDVQGIVGGMGGDQDAQSGSDAGQVRQRRPGRPRLVGSRPGRPPDIPLRVALNILEPEGRDAHRLPDYAESMGDAGLDVGAAGAGMIGRCPAPLGGGREGDAGAGDFRQRRPGQPPGRGMRGQDEICHYAPWTTCKVIDQRLAAMGRPSIKSGLWIFQRATRTRSSVTSVVTRISISSVATVRSR